MSPCDGYQFVEYRRIRDVVADTTLGRIGGGRNICFMNRRAVIDRSPAAVPCPCDSTVTRPPAECVPKGRENRLCHTR